MFGQDLPIFPETIRGAIVKMMRWAAGLALAVFAIAAILSVMYEQKDPGTWTTFSTGPDAGFFAKLIDLGVFAIGAAPMVFAMLFLMHRAALLIFDRARETSLAAMRALTASMLFSIALALSVGRNAGGVFGNFVLSDLGPLVGQWGCVVLSAVMLAVFIPLAFDALNLSIGKILKFFYLVGKSIDWAIGKLFGRNGPAAPLDTAISFTVPAIRIRSKPAKRKKIIRKKAAVANDDDEEEEIEYELPPPSLLEKSNFQSNIVTREHRQIASSMEVNFNKYGIFGYVREIHPGPIVTRYDFEPEDGQKINKIMETATDMRRAMATEQIRIALVPRTRYIGVEMVNQNRQFVYYQTLMADPEFTESKMQIPLALGVEISGRPFYADLAKMPHVLIAGRTGSGKSVFVQSIITSIVYHLRPDECKLVIVDPKGVDFNRWRDIPHLITPIVTDAAAAINVLKWTVREMEDRYRHLQLAEVQNIADYNALAEKMNALGKTIRKKVPVGTNEEGELEYEIKEVKLEHMPYIVLIMDEIADLMAQARKEVEACVQRITQKARAAGIHLVSATQRPDTSVITGIIKSNLPTRISFQARSYIDSMTTLGERGAEMLLAHGDMLYSESGKSPIRIHGAFIQDKEIDRIARFLRGQCLPEYIEGITDAAEDFNNSALGLPASADEKNGDLYNQAVEIVVRDRKPTVSYIQRRLGIGYNKAATLIEKMEAAGVITRMPSGKYDIA
jgi:S-DNA-T family DNA segregation ATPase FtsK/SpoIIIE